MLTFAEVDKKINSFSEFREEYVLNQAKVLDTSRRNGKLTGKLFGVPIGISDNISTYDFYTELGSKIYKGQQLSNDSTVVERLRKEDAIILGKTHISEFAVQRSSKTLNPYDIKKCPGGSMSGAAVAVATGLVPLSVGSQSNATIIRSASYCGVYGFKPSRNLVPCTGLIKKSSTTEAIGYFARTVEDLGFVLEIIAGYDGIDEKTMGHSSRNYLEILMQTPPFNPKFVFVNNQSFNKFEKSTKKVFRSLTKYLKKNLSEVDLPNNISKSEKLHKIIYEVELSHSLSKEFEKNRNLLSSGIKDKIISGKKISGCDYLKAIENSEKVKDAFLDFFEHFDAILAPATHSGAPVLGTNGLNDTYLSALWSLCGFPVVCLPLLKLDNSMPLGVQLIGAPNDDARLLRTARWLVNSFGSNQ